MGFGRKTKGLLSWVSQPKTEKENDPVFAKITQDLDELRKTLNGLQDSMRHYLASWHSMSQASAAIAEGLAKLAEVGGGPQEASPMQDMARMYGLAHRSIDGVVREPAHRVAEDMVLRQIGALLSRFPPIYKKIIRRRQLLADFTLAESKLRTAEAVQQKDRNRDPGMSTEQTRRLATSMETAASVANGVTQEVIADIDRFQDERGTMLVPQVSALVGCQAYFFRRSAAVMERLTTSLPFSSLALCRLVQPPSAAVITDVSDADDRFSSPLLDFPTASSSLIHASFSHSSPSTSNFSENPVADGGVPMPSSLDSSAAGGLLGSSSASYLGSPTFDRLSMPAGMSAPVRPVGLVSGGLDGVSGERDISRRPLPHPPMRPPAPAPPPLPRPPVESAPPADLTGGAAAGWGAADVEDEEDEVVEEVLW